MATVADAFSIRVLAGERTRYGKQLGEIRIGDFTERFDVYPFLGSVEVVQDRWRVELGRLVGGRRAIGLATASNMTWVLHRYGSAVRVNEMAMMCGIGPRLTTGGRVTRIRPCPVFNDDGQRISVWTTTVEAIRSFLTTSVGGGQTP